MEEGVGHGVHGCSRRVGGSAEVRRRRHVVVGGLRRAPEDDAGGDRRSEQHGKPREVGELGLVARPTQFDPAVASDHQHKRRDDQGERAEQVSHPQSTVVHVEGSVHGGSRALLVDGRPDDKGDGDGGGDAEDHRIHAAQFVKDRGFVRSLYGHVGSPNPLRESSFEIGIEPLPGRRVHGWILVLLEQPLPAVFGAVHGVPAAAGDPSRKSATVTDDRLPELGAAALHRMTLAEVVAARSDGLDHLEGQRFGVDREAAAQRAHHAAHLVVEHELLVGERE